MRYDLKKLETVSKRYKEILGNIRGKSALIVLDVSQKEAFYSLAPLSKAMDELGCDMNVQATNKKTDSLKALQDVWKCFNDLSKGVVNPKTRALNEFISIADKKCKGKLRGLFREPEIKLFAKNGAFSGSFFLEYDTSWMKEYRKKDLIKTSKVICKQVYNLRRREKMSIGFDLLRKKEDLGLPIGDYLDSFQISYAMMEAMKRQVSGMGAYTSRKSQMDEPERVSDLKTTLLGCELCKNVNEPLFRVYRKLSRQLRLDRIKVAASASFAIHGKGYAGRHYFGEYVGYPSQNRKTRWLSPGQMIYKLDYYPQTAIDPRPPMARTGFTETLPIDIYIKTCNIDWLAMKRRDDKIIAITKKCNRIIVEGKRFGKFQTKLEVGLVGKKRRNFRGSDVETRNLINPWYYKETGIKAGTMANIPGGEAFVTPEYVKGQFIGDVVISLDQSYRLSGADPMVVECYGNSYKVLRGPGKIIKKFSLKKEEAMKKLKMQEKNKSLPQNILEVNKRNFMNIGEFAINTNPKALLCNYLIVNEKIANMIHLALGSGFEADRATYYHTDIVIDSPRQQLDIYGISADGKKYWIHKKGKFVV